MITMELLLGVVGFALMVYCLIEAISTSESNIRNLPKIVDMFMDGKYKLRELVSQFVDLEDINRAYAQLEAGEVRRSVIRYT